jgi:hypothetical protein
MTLSQTSGYGLTLNPAAEGGLGVRATISLDRAIPGLPGAGHVARFHPDQLDDRTDALVCASGPYLPATGTRGTLMSSIA